MKKALFALLILAFAATSWAQNGSAFGVKGGPTMGFQKWNDFQQQPLFRYHGIVFIESLGDNVLFAQAGYHVKGSALRNTTFTHQNQLYKLKAQDFQFRNLSIVLGAKKKYDIGSSNTKAYYLLGIRGDYTINTNLSQYDDSTAYFLNISFPTDQWVRKLNYGATFGGGFEFPFSELIGGVLELTINPDLSKQYYQPTVSVPNPMPGSPPIQVSERRIINITVELTLGLRFLRLVEYID